MSAMRGMRAVVRPALQRRTALTTAANPYDTLKAKIEREPKLKGKTYRHSTFLNVRDKQLNDVWHENAVFFYSLALTPFLALCYLQ